MTTESYWTTTHTFPPFPAIDRDIEVDVVVVGAGLTGITTAYLLRQEGVRVALIERHRGSTCSVWIGGPFMGASGGM